MKPRITRLCIYPKDIQRVTGRSERYSREMLSKIKKALNKQEHQMVSVEEFCTYIGLPYESVKEMITD
ncbi:hypothetical protein [Chryseobacterium sp.]|uniref:hypothetical protein n=1 Tax=Chryseobacterium sp. TaxID=1871047 RepID=UPI0011C93640|nr:hypothetical protein [Chryseobacterium sp.]TXF77778.1 hypothetical protein FUA25_07600 [Chryseobacterium sp.]